MFSCNAGFFKGAIWNGLFPAFPKKLLLLSGQIILSVIFRHCYDSAKNLASEFPLLNQLYFFLFSLAQR